MHARSTLDAMRWLVLCLLAGCNWAFGLRETNLVDSPPLSEAGFRLVVPPDGATTCGALPSFGSWTSEVSTSLPVVAGRTITGMAFYETGGAQHVFLTKLDTVAGASLGVWDNDLAGTEVRLESLGPPPSGSVRAPSPTPDGEHLWFRQEAVATGTYYGSRTDGWQKQLTTLGLIDATGAAPSPVGFYNGTARMIVLVQYVSAPPGFVEISSADGLTWMQLETFKLALPGSPMPIGAYLSPDGCVVIVNVQAGVFYHFYAAVRDASGSFTGAPTEIDATGYGCCPTYPAMTTDLASFWFEGSNGQIVKKHP